MSSAISIETDQCTHCGTSYEPPTAYRGYCGLDCYYRERGSALIEQVEHTSQFCNTCYGHLRDVEPIPPAKIDGKGYNGDGWQYPTELTTVGVDEFRDTTPRLERTRISCRCGAVNPNETTAELQNVDLAACMTNLYRALCWLADREAIPSAPDHEAYLASLWDSPRDAALACGKAVYD